MVTGRLRYGLIVLLIVMWQSVVSQGHLFSEIGINKKSVYVGEPVEVSVSVYTSTWFTEGVNPGNIKVNGAYTIYFRGVSMSKQINGKTYAGVVMIFNVFPYRNEDIVFPALEIKVETPDKGGYKGVVRTIKTVPKTIRVKSVPAGHDMSKWLVSSSVDVKDVWKGDRNRVKVGDVLERAITITAVGTVSGLMPPVLFDSIQGVSSYPVGSSAENIRTKTAISAKRTDGVKYLFEKEGQVTIPAIEITWWNAGQKRLYKRTLKGVTLNVQPNPDLGMLESIRDSLNVVSSVEAASVDEDDGLLFGLTKKQLLFLLLIVFLVLYFSGKVFRLAKRLRDLIVQRKVRYQQSEKYYYKRFRKAAQTKRLTETVNALYVWIDKLEIEKPTLTYFIKTFGNENTLKDISLIERDIVNEESHISLDLKSWADARKKFLNQASGRLPADNSSWINPT